MDDESRVPINHESDIGAARREGRALADRLSFSTGELTVITTAISELARNIIVYAGHGEVLLRLVKQDGREGIQVIARDDGPGIANVELAMQDGYSTTKSLGLGLPGAKRLMDDFEIVSELGAGTTITMRKWAR